MDRLIDRREFLQLVGAGLGAGLAEKLGLGGEEDPLTKQQKKDLARTANLFLAETPQQAKETAKRIGFRNGLESPSNMCGPLAAAILNKSGVVRLDSFGKTEADFFLLDPREKPKLFEETFPGPDFQKWVWEEGTDKFDFGKWPLRAGDMVYLEGGTFEHALTVTEVDDKGRAWTVTNIRVGEGKEDFNVERVMLYDPGRPGEGQFFKWTDKENYRWGMTGTKAFWVFRWRKAANEGNISREAEAAENGKLASDWGALLGEYKAKWGIDVRMRTGTGEWKQVFRYGERQTLHPASTIKTAVGVLVLGYWERGGIKSREDLERQLDKGTGGRSFGQLLEAMLVKSEEAATAELVQYLKRQKVNIKAGLEGLGMADSTLEPRRSTARDMANLWRMLSEGKVLHSAGGGKLRGWLGQFTEGDKGRMGMIKEAVPGMVIYNKRGSLTVADGKLVVADTGVAEGPTVAGVTVAASVISNGVKDGANYEELEEGLGKMFMRLGEFVRSGE